MRLEYHAFGKGVAELDGADDRQADAAFAVVSYLGHAGGCPEGACACEALFSEYGPSGLEVGVEPVPEGVAEVHEGAFGDAAGHLGYEGVVLFLAGVEGLVEVLP